VADAADDLASGPEAAVVSGAAGEHPRSAALDLEPATSALAGIVQNIGDDRLGAPTPCPGADVGALLDHVDGLCRAFTAAAAKTPLDAPGGTGSSSAARLPADWRVRIPARLAELAQAWRDPEAWSGMTAAGGVEMPGEVTALVALDEVVVHGWDLAVATGQPYAVDERMVAAARDFVEGAAAENPEGTPGLFGPPVRVAPEAPALDQLLGLTGRDPVWRPPG
jgi:uncharacterized protein (TIGR03086 family)